MVTPLHTTPFRTTPDPLDRALSADVSMEEDSPVAGPAADESEPIAPAERHSSSPDVTDHGYTTRTRQIMLSDDEEDVEMGEIDSAVPLPVVEDPEFTHLPSPIIQEPHDIIEELMDLADEAVDAEMATAPPLLRWKAPTLRPDPDSAPAIDHARDEREASNSAHRTAIPSSVAASILAAPSKRLPNATAEPLPRIFAGLRFWVDLGRPGRKQLISSAKVGR